MRVVLLLGILLSSFAWASSSSRSSSSSSRGSPYNAQLLDCPFFISGYRFEEEVANGGFSRVFKGLDADGNRVALKVFSPFEHGSSNQLRIMRSGIADFADRMRFYQEFEVLDQLYHPLLPAVYELYSNGRQIFFSMEWIDGIDIEDFLVEFGTFSEEVVLLIAYQLSHLLIHLEQNGVIHRDIKPTNIILPKKTHANRIFAGSYRMVPRLVDFGLAVPSVLDPIIYDGHSILGSPGYMAPERLAELFETDDGRSDLFGLGIVLYEMITGVQAFPGASDAARNEAILSRHPDPIRDHRDDIQDDLIRVVEKLLRKNVTQRYQSATEVLVELSMMLTIRGLLVPDIEN